MASTGYVSTLGVSEEKPQYRKFRQDDNAATPHFGIVCDEGWKQSIVCTGMYEWAADWLIEQIQGKPYSGPRKGKR